MHDNRHRMLVQTKIHDIPYSAEEIWCKKTRFVSVYCWEPKSILQHQTRRRRSLRWPTDNHPHPIGSGDVTAWWRRSGVMTSADDQNFDLRIDYRRHFNPLIQLKIAAYSSRLLGRSELLRGKSIGSDGPSPLTVSDVKKYYADTHLSVRPNAKRFYAVKSSCKLKVNKL